MAGRSLKSRLSEHGSCLKIQFLENTMANAMYITSGPSKYDLMLALFDSTSGKPRPVEFSTKTTGEIKLFCSVHIQSIQREDGSGESWNYIGWIGNQKKVAGYYSTKTRSGTLTVE